MARYRKKEKVCIVVPTPSLEARQRLTADVLSAEQNLAADATAANHSI